MTSLLDAKFGSDSEEDDADYDGEEGDESSSGASSGEEGEGEGADDEEDGEFLAVSRGRRGAIGGRGGEREGRNDADVLAGGDRPCEEASGVHTPHRRGGVCGVGGDGGRSVGEGREEEEGRGRGFSGKKPSREEAEEGEEKNTLDRNGRLSGGDGGGQGEEEEGLGRRRLVLTSKASRRTKGKRGRGGERAKKKKKKKKAEEEEERALRRAKLAGEVSSIFREMRQESRQALHSYVSATKSDDILLQFHRRYPSAPGAKKNKTLAQLQKYLSIAVSSCSSGLLSPEVVSRTSDANVGRGPHPTWKSSADRRERETDSFLVEPEKESSPSSSPSPSAGKQRELSSPRVVSSGGERHAREREEETSAGSSLQRTEESEGGGGGGGGRAHASAPPGSEGEASAQLSLIPHNTLQSKAPPAGEECRTDSLPAEEKNLLDVETNDLSLSTNPRLSAPLHSPPSPVQDFSIRAIKHRVRGQREDASSASERDEGGEEGERGRKRKQPPRAREVEEMVRQAILEASQEDAGEVTVKKVVRFAGQNVEVERCMEAESREYQNFLKQRQKNPKLGGRFAQLDHLLSELDGPASINSVQKSQADWDKFKRDKGIEAELKSGHGYLDKQAFLAATEWRQHEKNVEVRRRLQLQQQMQQPPPR